jgi:hypothetical protein
MTETEQMDVHKDGLVESVVVLYPRVCDFGATSVSASLTYHGQSFPYVSKTSRV